MYDFVCNHCESTQYPELEPMFYLDYTGTERQELVPRCADCGETGVRGRADVGTGRVKITPARVGSRSILRRPSHTSPFDWSSCS